MPQECATNYVCTPKWYTSADQEVTDEFDVTTGTNVIAYAAGPYAQGLNVVCDVRAGTVQFQVQDRDGVWFTPTEASYTVNDSNLVRLPRANMPDMRIIATGDAAFYIEGSLR